MPDLVKVSRALISVSDKTDLLPFARTLASMGVRIISTGGTARALSEAGVPVIPIESITGFPEILSGRVKTLHPAVHGPILALRDDPGHAQEVERHRFTPIDLVCVNLYPFERAISSPGVSMADAIEQIDVGGPAMLRSAAKNFAGVVPVSSPSQYDRVIGALRDHAGCTPRSLRAELAASAFSRTAEYDAAIASFLGRHGEESGAPLFPQVLRLGYLKVDELRYGENPHQEAALYRDPASTGPSVINSRQLHGKDLSYNNVLDSSAALELVKALRRLDPSRVGACVVKHTNPCGAALGVDASSAVRMAIEGDPMAAYGGILALNRAVDAEAAALIAAPDRFFEVVIAPEFSPEAIGTLSTRWASVRLLATGERVGSATRKLDYRSVPGGMLVQDRDVRIPDPRLWTHTAGPAPTESDLADAAFGVCVARSLSSNAVAIVVRTPQGVKLAGAGAGQMDRVASAANAIAKAGPLAKGAEGEGSIAVSDGFFPFPDAPTMLINAGVRLIVHPGGSKRDDQTRDLCAQRAATCLVTGVRHFRH